MKTIPRFAVSDEKQRQLQLRMEELDIREEDLRETFSRSSGAGGQHVNKTATRVHIKHLPTGISAVSAAERSQSLNRFLARRALLEQIAALSGEMTRQTLERKKIRKQKARRRRRSCPESAQ